MRVRQRISGHPWILDGRLGPGGLQTVAQGYSRYREPKASPSPVLQDNAHVSKGCMNRRSGLTRIEAKVEGIINRKEQDWWVMCESTPFTWDGVKYTNPVHCEERVCESQANLLVPKVNRSYPRALVQRLQCGMFPQKAVGNKPHSICKTCYFVSPGISLCCGQNTS